MEQKQFAETYLMANAKYFPSDKIGLIKDKLLHLPEERQTMIQSLELKNPTTTLLLSLLFGGLAIDRFYLGDIGLGICKIISILFIVGIFWALADIYFCYKKTKEVNFNRFMLLI